MARSASDHASNTLPDSAIPTLTEVLAHSPTPNPLAKDLDEPITAEFWESLNEPNPKTPTRYGLKARVLTGATMGALPPPIVGHNPKSIPSPAPASSPSASDWSTLEERIWQQIELRVMSALDHNQQNSLNQLIERALEDSMAELKLGLRENLRLTLALAVQAEREQGDT